MLSALMGYRATLIDDGRVCKAQLFAAELIDLVAQSWPTPFARRG